MTTSRSDERREVVTAAEAELEVVIAQAKAEQRAATQAARARKRSMDEFEHQFAASVRTVIVPAMQYIREAVKDLLDLTVREAGSGHVVEVSLVSTRRQAREHVLIALRPDPGSQTVRCLGIGVVLDRLPISELSQEIVKQMSIPAVRAALKGQWTKDS